jgi:hypothetical protein
MMETAPVLRWPSSQVAQLIGYCTVYRAYLWQSCQPTPERNQVLRNTQALQGKLEKAQEQAATEIALSFTGEERQTIRQLLSSLIQYYANSRPSEARTQQLAELSSFRATLERMIR